MWANPSEVAWRGTLEKFGARSATKGRCPFCGWTEIQFEQTQLMGCPLCYDALGYLIFPPPSGESLDPAQASIESES